MEGILMDKEKAQLILINFQIKKWSGKQISFIDKSLVPLKSNWGSTENNNIIKKSLENSDELIRVDGIPYIAHNILNGIKSELAESIVKIMEDNKRLSISDLVSEVEVDRAKKNTKTGKVEIINPLEEDEIDTSEDLFDYVLKSKDEVVMVDVTYSNNIDEYIADGGGEIIEGFLKTLIGNAKNNNDREVIEAFETLDGVWDVVDALNERVNEYVQNN